MRLAIIGCGLIGGSLGLAIKRRRPSWEVVCLDQPDGRPAIEEAGFADQVGTMEDAPRLLPGASLVVLATPVEVILDLLPDIAPHLDTGTIVTDVGGTKTEIARRAAEVLPDGVHFVGGHPIAGSERSGVAAADPLLFKGKVYVLCPAPATPPEALLTLLDMVEDLRALPLTIEPEEHDRILAMVSHLPQLLAIALVHAALEEDNLHSLLDITVGKGFLDLTRIAASRFEPWQGVLATNRESIAAALGRLEESVAEVRRALDGGELKELWERVSAERRRMRKDTAPRPRKTDLRALIDLHDERLLKVLGDRLQVVRRIGKLKSDREAPVYDPERERRMIVDRKDWARALGLPEDLVEELFEAIVRHSKRLQRSD